jgi:shikimate 5-dehydrogenase
MSKRKVLLGLIGSNIMGSLSPAVFADAFVAAGIDGFYHLMDVDRLLERRLAKLLDAAKVTGFAGTNTELDFGQKIYGSPATRDAEHWFIFDDLTCAFEHKFHATEISECCPTTFDI